MDAIQINVIQEDIDDGERGDCENCMVSQALWRYFPNSEVESSYNDEKGEAWAIVNGMRYSLHGALDFMMLFDDGKVVFPFSFEMVLD